MDGKKKIKLLCTLGPASLRRSVIERLDLLGVDIFRINLSHTNLEDVEKTVKFIQLYTDKPICLDTEGAQIRNGDMAKGRSRYTSGSVIRIYKKEIVGDSSRMCLKPRFVFDELCVGDIVSVDFDNLLLKICSRKRVFLEAEVMSKGSAGSNKAVTVDRPIRLPTLTKKDRDAIEVCLRCGITHFALSFTNKKEDVGELRSLVGKDAVVISKIESKMGVENVNDILRVSDAILIDRGDLSREKPLETVPFLQKYIIRQAVKERVPVYVATNLLESMVNNIVPTRAEVNDIMNTLIDGADGLVLAAETAIGKYPVACVAMVKKAIGAFNKFSEKSDLSALQIRKQEHSLSLIEPHGGHLVNRMCDGEMFGRGKNIKKLFIDEMALIDAEQIASGAYSPLTGFMTRKEIASVLASHRLPGGPVWTLPIVLQVHESQALRLRNGDKVALVYEGDKEIYGTLQIEDVYKYDFHDIAMRWYGTDSLEHPGVCMLKNRGAYFLGGDIGLYKFHKHDLGQFTLTPTQVRHIFEKRGWFSIVGFHTRNVVHRAHEHIQLSALEKSNVDGLFIHPVIGPKRKNDFSPEVIMKSYMMAVEKHYPRDKVLMAAFHTYPRYAGPREAVFTAICRKNFGCDHFIIGRDHTGTGARAVENGAEDLFKEVGDIGIKPIYFEEVYYCRKCRKYVERCAHGHSDALHISGSEIRRFLQNGVAPEELFMRGEIAQMIIGEMKRGKEVFVK